MDIPNSKLIKTVNNWQPAREVFSAFIEAHPELGLRNSPVTFRNFCSRHGNALIQLDVMRKPYGIRSPAIFNIDRFDDAAFNLITNRVMPPTSLNKAEVRKC